MKCIKALATSSADLPFIASCHNTPVGFKVLDFFQLPATANVSLKRTNLLQNIACFRPGSLGNIITFCISTDIATSCFSYSRSFSSRLRDLASVAAVICFIKLTQSSQPSNVSIRQR